jgi:hypothetical protein
MTVIEYFPAGSSNLKCPPLAVAATRSPGVPSCGATTTTASSGARVIVSNTSPWTTPVPTPASGAIAADPDPALGVVLADAGGAVGVAEGAFADDDAGDAERHATSHIEMEMRSHTGGSL